MVPPGEEADEFYPRVAENLKHFDSLDLFTLEQVLQVAANWARTTKQTPDEVREGVVWERQMRELSAARHFRRR